MPVWCWLMPFVIFNIAGGEIDTIWWLAMLLPIVVGVACGTADHRWMMWYSFAVAVGVLAICLALPTLNRARS